MIDLHGTGEQDKFDRLPVEQKEIVKILLEWYEVALLDVKSGINLSTRLFEVNKLIQEVDDKIADLQIKGDTTEPYMTLKNEIYFLKYSILEQI